MIYVANAFCCYIVIIDFNQAKSAAEFIHLQGTGADLENLPGGVGGATFIQMIRGEYSNQRLRLRMISMIRIRSI